MLGVVCEVLCVQTCVKIVYVSVRGVSECESELCIIVCAVERCFYCPKQIQAATEGTKENTTVSQRVWCMV